MNMILKSAVGAALALAAVGANALGVPATNSSDLVLVIQNQATPANVYVLDTGISLNTALGTGATVSHAVLNNTAFTGINQTIAESTTLQAFLAANPAAGDGWAIEGGQYSALVSTANPTNSATKAPGKAWGIFSSASGATNLGTTQLGTFQGFLGGIQNDLTQPVDGLSLKPLLTATEASTGTSYSTAAQNKYGLVASNDVSPLGSTAITLYGMTGDNSTTTAVQSYILGTVSLATNGTLQFSKNGGTSPVPLPAAVWLFGSGLLGLVGVSRRRKATV
jgi:hypothetical protein